MSDLDTALDAVANAGLMHIVSFQRPDIPSALLAVSDAYSQFLLDPRAAIKPRRVLIRLYEFARDLATAAAGDKKALVGITWRLARLLAHE